MIGNSLDHYDSALYIFLAPFLAPLFFPNHDPALALILTYGIKLSTLITRPAGAIIFGHLAKKYCTKKLLLLTLMAVTISTTLIGFLPTHASIGIAAPILLASIRAIQGFFAAGEHAISSLFILDQVKEVKKHGKASSYYLLSIMMGTLLASTAAWLVSISGAEEELWRAPFLFGIFTGVFGIIIRQVSDFTQKPKDNNHRILDSAKSISKNKWKIIKLIPISSFAFITYTIPFVFINNITPEISDIRMQDLLGYSTILIAINNLLIPVFAHFIDRFDIYKWMASLSFLFTISIVPIFIALPYLGIHGINFAKLWIIVIGVAFVAPLNSLMFRLVPSEEKYLISGIGYSIGTELLGKKTNIICLALWYWSGSLFMSAAYLATISSLATASLISEYFKQRQRIESYAV